MKYYVDMGIKFESQEDWGKVNKTADTVLGSPDSAGTGFGVRDSQWYFDSEDEAREAAGRLQAAFDLTTFEVEYIDVASEPETADEMRSEGWSEEDIEDYFKESK